MLIIRIMIRESVLLLTCAMVSATFLLEGDNCTISSLESMGRCINIHQCEYANKLLKEKKHPQVCGFKGNVPLVCCPSHASFKSLNVGSKSIQMCSRYHDAEQQVEAIDLGSKALSKEFPHMAAIGYGDNKTSILWLCGGSLISNYFALSAAHCVQSREFGPAKWIRLGDLDLKNTTYDANPQDIAIYHAYTHPKYRYPSHYHDIALFKFEREIYFGLDYKPACLHTKKHISVETLQAIGWGQLGIFGESSSHLMKVDLKFVSHEVCVKKYSDVSVRKLKDGILDDHQICAGSSEGGDTCPGDSGGPLHYMVDWTEKIVEHFVVAGVTSFGKGCGGENSIGVYTRVSSYIDWIENIVWSDEIVE